MGISSGVGFLFHPIHRQRRYEGSREDIRGYHRKNHGLGQRRKEVLSDSRQEEDRHENNTDAQSRNEGRYRNLGGAFTNGVQLRFSLSQVPIDVFNGNRGVVHQDTNGQRQTARVIMLMVSPKALSVTIEHRIANGIEIAIIRVLRKSPKKSRIISAVKQAAITPSLTTPSIAAVTKMD